MLEKMWKDLENAEEKSTSAEILAWTYFNPPGEQIKDIQVHFDSWDLEDFELVYDQVLQLPPLEGEMWHETRFGITDFVSKIDFFEGSNLSILPEYFWFKVSKPNIRQKFF